MYILEGIMLVDFGNFIKFVLKHELWFGEIIPIFLKILMFFMCSLSPNIFNYACPDFRATCSMALMITLKHEFELPMLPSIPSNGHIGGGGVSPAENQISSALTNYMSYIPWYHDMRMSQSLVVIDMVQS